MPFLTALGIWPTKGRGDERRGECLVMTVAVVWALLLLISMSGLPTRTMASMADGERGEHRESGDRRGGRDDGLLTEYL